MNNQCSVSKLTRHIPSKLSKHEHTELLLLFIFDLEKRRLQRRGGFITQLQTIHHSTPAAPQINGYSVLVI